MLMGVTFIYASAYDNAGCLGEQQKKRVTANNSLIAIMEYEAG